MKQDNLPEMPPGKYNPWCQKRPLVCTDTEQLSRASSYFLRKNLSSSEQAAFYLHELTGCTGFEFVAFSNAKLPGVIELTGNVVLVPCFLSDTDGYQISDSLVRFTHQMEQRCRFIYDGWVPIATWDEHHVHKVVQDVDKALSVFCIRGRTFFDWESKYPTPDKQRSAFYFEEEHLQDLKSVSRALDGLNEDDRTAIYRSLAWLSQGMRVDEPAARFLFSILAIESLATYIEEKAPGGSPLIVFRTRNVTDGERVKCIKDTLARLLDQDPEEAVKRAYSDCVRSITGKLKRHLENAFASDTESYELLFEQKVDGKTLYGLRNYVAHGTRMP